MKHRSILQRYLFDSRVFIVLFLLLAILLSVVSSEAGVVFSLFLIIYLIYKNRASSGRTDNQILIVENKKINNDCSITLIQYKNRRYLIFSNKNFALNVMEEETDV